MGDNESHVLLHRIEALELELSGLRTKLLGDVDAERLAQVGFECLECQLADRTVGILEREVSEVVMVPELVPIPEAPPWVSGLMNLRGTLVPVVNVLGRIEKRRRALGLSDVVIVCTADGRRVGLIVQDAAGIRTVPPKAVQKPPSTVPFAPYVVALVPDPERPLLLLSARVLIATSSVPEPAP